MSTQRAGSKQPGPSAIQKVRHKLKHHPRRKHNPITHDIARAYHESGHALVAYLMNRHFKTLSICNGEHSHEKFPARRWEAFTSEKCADPAIRDRVERNLMELYAGDVAQEILTGKPVTRWESSDFHHITELGACAMETGEVLDAYLHYMALRTKHLLMQPQNWDTIQILADELIKKKRLDYRTAHRILDQAMNIGLVDLMHHTLRPAGEGAKK